MVNVLTDFGLSLEINVLITEIIREIVVIVTNMTLVSNRIFTFCVRMV